MSDTSSTISTRAPPSPLSNWERSVAKAFRDGDLECALVDHADRGPKRECADKKFRPFPVRKTNAAILELMKPYKDAKCPCERAACKSAWLSNHPGQLQQEFVCNGSWQKGVGKFDPTMPGKKVLPVPFRLSDIQRNTLMTRFPDWMFIQTSSSGHDHPVSHCTTQIAGYELLKALESGSPKAPKRYLDLHGNPKSNMRMSGDTKKIETLVGISTVKDYVRQATKWGPEFTGSKRNYHVGQLRDLPRDFEHLSSIDRLLSINTLYYYDPSELAAALAVVRDHTMEAIIHRHQGDSGELNLGELQWVKENDSAGRATVKQTNKLTGESYIHPCTERYFTKTFWTPHKNVESALAAGDKLDSLAWTINSVCDGLMRLTIVAVPAKAAAIDLETAFDSAGTTAPVNTKRYLKVTNTVKFEVYGEQREVSIAPEHHEVYDKCRKRMHAKTRDEASFRAHATFCLMQCNGVAKTVDLDSRQLRDITLSSFWVDQREDVSVAMAGNFWTRSFAKQQSLLINGGCDMQKGLSILLDGAITVLSSKDKKDCAIKLLHLSKSVAVSK